MAWAAPVSSPWLSRQRVATQRSVCARAAHPPIAAARLRASSRAAAPPLTLSPSPYKASRTRSYSAACGPYSSPPRAAVSASAAAGWPRFTS